MQADLEARNKRLAHRRTEEVDRRFATKMSGCAKSGATVKDLERQLEKARVKDPDAAERVRRGIEELRAQIDLIEESQKWPSMLESPRRGQTVYN